MYKFYLGKVLLPVAPQKVQRKIDGANKTITLINGDEINQIKGTKLTEITFECLLPRVQYPFAKYKNGFKTVEYYLDAFEKKKNSKKPFEFVIKVRQDQVKNDVKKNVEIGADIVMDVTLEKYTITDDAKNGTDVMVSITLKEYRTYGTKKIVPQKDRIKKGSKSKVKKNSSRSIKKTTAKTYTVKVGDTLKLIAKKQCGTSSKANEIYTLNKKTIESTAIKHGKKSSSNGYWIWAGEKLKLPS